MEKTFTRIAFDLTPGDVMVGGAGGHSMVENVEPSSSMPGLLVVETEHGSLYMDPEQELEILA